MAIYHSSTHVLSRGKGHSAVAAAAYRSGERLYDERLGETYDWSQYRKSHGEVLASEIFLPEDADEKYYDREVLWNAVETFEKTKAGEYKKTAAIAREIENSLPSEMSDEERYELSRTYAEKLVDRYHTSVDMNIHAPHLGGNQKNYHAHFLLGTRELDENGFGQKCELELNGKTKKMRGLGTGREQIEDMRRGWADHVNAALERYDYAGRIDHRSLKDQGIDRIPAKHLGQAASAMERRGEKTRIGDENREVEEHNRDLVKLEMQERKINESIEAEKQIMKAEKEQQQQQKLREQWAQTMKQHAEKERQIEAERVRKDAIHIDRQGSFADELDKTRAAEFIKEKEDARIEEIYGQQEKNIEEARKHGHNPLDDYDPPAPEIEPQEPQHESAKELLDQYERAAATPPDPIEPEPAQPEPSVKLLDEYEQAANPPPEIDQPEPEPQYDNASEMLDSYEKAAPPSNDNTPDQGQSVEPSHDTGKGPSHDVGGYER